MGNTKFKINRNEAIIGMFAAAKELSSQFSRKVKSNPDGIDFGKYQSSIILHSLAIELSLKYLLDNDGKSYKKTHSIKTLLSQFDSEFLDSVKAQYGTRQKVNTSWLSFDDLIVDIDHIFVNWRYATFDGSSLAIQIDSWIFFGEIIEDLIR